MGDMRYIVVVPYNPRWPDMFQQEAELLGAVFGAELLALHHIGSTSVPGLSAKPIIDVMPVVTNIETVGQLNPAMIQLGYEPMGEHGILGRRYFRKGGDIHRTHHVHTFQAGNVEVARHLDFRDYLIAHPQAAQEYAALKIKGAKQFLHNIHGYMDGKDAFIRKTIERARCWRAGQEDTVDARSAF